MKSYTERNIFTEHVVQAHSLATFLVESIPFDKVDGKEIRCHELARAVSEVLMKRGYENVVQDGHLWAIEHSWIVLDAPYGKILDVYTPGRIPQVQLLDVHFAITRGYHVDPVDFPAIRRVGVEILRNHMMQVQQRWEP